MFETLLMEKLQIIPYSKDGKTVHRIVDGEGTLVAKVNGPRNLPICKDMVQAYNDRGRDYDRMKSLLRFRLSDILRDVKGSSMWAYAIRKVFNEEGDVEQLVQELKSQAEDNRPLMVSILGGEAVQILELI